MGMVKNRKGKDLKETKEIKMWQAYTELYRKKGLSGLDNYDGVVTHIEPDILELESNWP